MPTKKRIAYRDSLTGRFVSKSTWKRSRSHGGTRYKRSGVRSGTRAVRTKRTPTKAVRPITPPGVITREGPIIPAEFLAAQDEYFDSGYESDEEEEY